MRKRCEAPQCGKTFEAKRAAAKFCSPACRKRNSRADKRGATVLSIVDLEKGVDLRLDPPEPTEPSSAAEGPLTTATRKQLDAAGRLDTALGIAVLLIAMRLDNPMSMADTGSSYASLHKDFRAALAEALKDARTESDPLDKIRASAALKLVSGGAE